MLDTLCLNYYGHLNGSVELVLEANEGLAREPQPFRSGIVIRLPDMPIVTNESVSLWD
jgi:phage tail protein X